MARTRATASTFATRLNLPLAAIVAAGFALTAYFTLKVTHWAVMTDELQHVKLGVSIAETLNPLPRVRGEALSAYGQLYPLLTAPVYALFDMPSAFKVAHALNALIMASTAIPAYLLARSVLGSRGFALTVAGLSVVVPWMGMAHLMMTEVAAYPAFTWAIFGIYNALANPRPRNDLLALLAVALAVLARTQFLLLLAALPVAVLVHELGFAAAERGAGRLRARLAEGFRRVWRGHLLLVLAGIAGVVGYLALQLTGQVSVILGAYSGTVSGDLSPAGTGRMAAELWGVAAVAVGVIPVVAGVGWALSTLVRPTDRRGHAFAVLLVVVAPLLTWQVASFLIRFSGVLQDRYFFYLVPLLFVAMVACLRDPRPRLVGVAVATGVVAWLITLIDLTPTAPRPYWGSPSVTFNQVLSGRSYGLGNLFGIDDLGARPVVFALTVLAGVALVVALWKLTRRPVAVTACALVAVFCVVETAYTNDKFADALGGGSVAQKDWVDERIPAGASSALVPGGVNSAADGRPVQLDQWAQWGIWWEVEFWNESADRSFQFEDDRVAVNAPFFLDRLDSDHATGEFPNTAGTPYLVVSATDVRQRIAAESLHVDGPSGLELLESRGPLRLDWLTEGLAFDGTPSSPGDPVKIRVFTPPGEPPRERELFVTVDSAVDSAAQVPVTLSAPGARASAEIVPGNLATAVVTLCAKPPYTDVTLRLPDSAPGGGDPVALHVARIHARSPRDECRRRLSVP